MDIKRTGVNQLKAGAALSYISMALGYIISIVYTPLMLRLLGKSEYGLYNLVSSIVSYLGLLSFGFGSAYMRYFSIYKVNNDREKIARLNGMFLIVYTIIGVIAFFVGIILVSNINFVLGKKFTITELNTAKILMAILVFNIALSFPASVFNSHIIANEKFIFNKIMQMLKTLLNPFITLPILLMGYGSIGLVLVTTIINIVVEVSNSIYCFKKLNIKFAFNKFDFKLMKEMTIFSSYVFINMIIDQINWNVDKFILGRYRGTGSVAVYGLAAQLNTYYLSLSTAISNVFIPRVNRMVATNNSNNELTSLFTRVGRIQFILLSLICSGLIFLGQPFISMWAGSEYLEAYPIVLLLVIPVTIPLIQNIGIEIQKAKNMHQFRSWIYLAVAMINTCISIPLAKEYGGVGAAIGTAIALLFGNGLIMNWYYHNKVGLNIRYFWSQILKLIPAILPNIAFGVIINFFVDLYNIVLFLICGIAYIMVFCISMWYFGMNEYEKELVGKPIARVFTKIKLYSEKKFSI